MTGDEAGAESTFEVRDNTDDAATRRWIDGELAGYSEYEPRDGWLVFVRTVVDPAFEGKGVGSRLARWALDDVRARGLKLTPQCPLISAVISSATRTTPDLAWSACGGRLAPSAAPTPAFFFFFFFFPRRDPDPR